MHEIKGFIFDLDGVIVSTDDFHYSAWKHIADREGIYFDEEINNRLRGVSRMESLEIILERSTKQYSDEEKNALAEDKNSYYKQLLNSLSPNDRLPGVTETLKFLKEKGYKIAIGSSSKNARFILQKIGLGTTFDAISDGNNIKRTKPDPEVFLKAAEMLGFQPKECVVVEDALAGVEAGLSGGFYTVAIGDAIKYNKANRNVTSFNQIQCLGI